MNKLILLIIFLLFSGLVRADNLYQIGIPQTNLKRTVLKIGNKQIEVQDAITMQQKSLGLMYHKQLQQNDGMLFRFDVEQKLCFWMKNTYVALTAAFIDEQGTIIHLTDMEPLDETNHCAAEPAKYVLEMNKGWFDVHNIKVGDVVLGLD